MEINLLQEYTFVCLDIFNNIIHNKDKKIENKLEEWLVFLSQDDPDMIMKLLDRTLMHYRSINSLFTMPFYKDESGIIFVNFICLLVFLVKLSIIHCFIILRMMEIEGFLMIIKHILMLFNHEFFNMIMYQYVILPDVLLNYRLLL